MRLRHITESQVKKVIALAINLNKIDPSGGIQRASKSSPQRKALLDYIKHFSDDARHELTALMWLGRGDDGSDFQSLLETAYEWSDFHDAEYIVEQSLSLPSFLQRGLATPGRCGEG
jgi:hypothetical protein